MCHSRRFVLLGGLFACGCGSSAASAAPGAAACTVTPPSAPDARLRADGTSFRDALGRIVFLRGVDAGGRSKFAPYVPFDFGTGQYATALGSYMDRAASWGIDAMRVPFTWAALEPAKGQNDASWLSLYDQLLDAAWTRGIYTVVDFHQDVYSEVYCGDGFPGWTVPNAPAPHHDCPQWQFEYFNDPGVKAAFDAFWAPGSTVEAAYTSAWDVMVARYKDKPGVVGFEPINEPGWGSADEGTFAATTLTSFYSQMVARMRAAAPDTLVFVDLPGVDGVSVTTMLGRPTGDGIVFAPHYYPLSPKPDAVQSGLSGWAAIGQTWNTPTFVGEFGITHDSAGASDFMAAHFAALDALGISGTEWEYSVANDSWNGETDGMVAADGTEFAVTLAIIRPYARAVAGDGVTQSYDAASRVYDLTYAPGSGVTEVSLPARAYATGYRLTLAGACVDATSVAGRLLLRNDPGAAKVELRIQPK